MIRVHQVTHHYDVRPILLDVSFDVEAGELVSIVGPNGMGKSTLLGVLAGILWPVEGYVEIGGHRRRDSIEAEQAIRRLVHYLPDAPFLPGDRTGREFLVAVGQVYDVPHRELFDHVDRLLALFELEEQENQAIGGYSNGQKHKIAVAAALVSQAPVLLLDEPFGGGLDPAGILALKKVMQHLAATRAATVMMTTPVPELVAEIATRVLVLRQGKLQLYETPQELCKRAGTQSLDQALQRLVFPETMDNLRRYFDARDHA